MGSFNNDARKVRNPRLPLPKRAVALRSCLSKCSWAVCGGPYSRVLKHFGTLVGADLQKSAQEHHLLAALDKLEITRNRILSLRFAYERKRIRQKMCGNRVPNTAEWTALQEAFESVRHSENVIPRLLPSAPSNPSVP